MAAAILSQATPFDNCEVHRLIISRKEARAAGLKKYFTGVPCKHGHISERDTDKNTCIICKNIWDKEHPRKYREKRKSIPVSLISGVHERIISRKDAKFAGFSRFFTGKPCKLGHIAERSVSNGMCVACRNIHTREYQKRQRHSGTDRGIHFQKMVKEANLFRLYGIGVDQYNAMLQAQNGVCAICGKEETSQVKGHVKRTLAVDHDHATGKVRGLLCARCNRDLSAFEKRANERNKFEAYLRGHLSVPLSSSSAALMCAALSFPS
jgi:hypothetical protein